MRANSQLSAHGLDRGGIWGEGGKENGNNRDLVREKLGGLRDTHRLDEIGSDGVAEKIGGKKSARGWRQEGGREEGELARRRLEQKERLKWSKAEFIILRS